MIDVQFYKFRTLLKLRNRHAKYQKLTKIIQAWTNQKDWNITKTRKNKTLFKSTGQLDREWNASLLGEKFGCGGREEDGESGSS